MKTGVYSVLFAIISDLAIGFCFVPILLLLRKKMRLIKTYWFLGVYWLLNGLVNFPPRYLSAIPGGRLFFHDLNLFYNFFEAPLLLLVFACASQGRMRKQLLIVLAAFAVGELAVMRWNGSGNFSTALIMAVGMLLILAYSIIGLIFYMRKMEHTPFEHSMAFVYAAFLFEYGSYLIIFIFAHVHSAAASNNGGTDSFLLYYASLLLSAGITSLGLWSFGVRPVRQDAPAAHYSSF